MRILRWFDLCVALSWCEEVEGVYVLCQDAFVGSLLGVSHLKFLVGQILFYFSLIFSVQSSLQRSTEQNVVLFERHF